MLYMKISQQDLRSEQAKLLINKHLIKFLYLRAFKFYSPVTKVTV